MSDQYPTQPGAPGWCHPASSSRCRRQGKAHRPGGSAARLLHRGGQRLRRRGLGAAHRGDGADLGMWLPVLATYLIGWRKRTVTLHVSDGVVVRVESS
jgi:hypothetical protein